MQPGQKDSAAGARTVVAFVCANCARAGMVISAGSRPRPQAPYLAWPARVKQVIVPCSGRLAPEHILKAFEDGADAVAVVACQDDNCHYVQGSCRAARRVEYVGGLLDEIGLGKARLMLMHLPGSARQDMFADQPGQSEQAAADLQTRLQQVRQQVAQVLKSLTPSPFRTQLPSDEQADSYVEQADDTED
jgi:F420-non-reducing hydrogenase iron-sulfur subunit